MDIFRKPIKFDPKSKKLTLAFIVPVGLAAIGVPAYIFATSSNFTWQSTKQSHVTPKVVVQKPVIPTVAALGRIQTKDKIINLSGPSALQTARLDQVLVKEGDNVRRGQLIAVLDNVSQLQTTLAKAQMGVRVAQSQLSQAQAGTTKQGEIAAQQARIASLQAQFQGDINIHKSKIAGLEAQLRNAETEYGRFRSLYEQGAISAVTKDTKLLAVETLQAQLKEAQSSLNQTLSSFPKQIQEAKASLAELKEVRPVDVQVAQSELERAKAAVLEAKANLALAYVRSPMNAKILKVNTFPGETISEKGIVELAQTQQMYVVAEIYETDVSKIKIGQKAEISSKALPKGMIGTVEKIGVQIGKRNVVNNDPSINIDSRVAEIKIRLDPADTKEAANFINLQVDVKIKNTTTV
ncbi:heterocyst specific ABC-transporter, membrane fusion protein DevB [Trichormus variabilis ATCC 29413]|uniref:Heterocyst specific ABC-transporter, membrane fusion protein DevB n=2 Tax=Anabaena variabilis TaxID=264691 RepID=Q3M5N2_TRIV2|nr:ABC exporter membrane fusion protein [Trichormus variabilis]MBC1265564.1 ABC exporter membrane fusion protein [Trichormus variabilis FSR]QFZ13262.1 HlyD family secretion protein [Anabaena sp. YBS01]ABA23704.1 heterocyst specific ABC-transporter, membrane fusion protein DevB [Trichormus variabilis ATCC 29413]MBC1213134.1 ABC exporter membrane fusion protein [Trichormus variabilis ARAD]MBC1254465.1 ABC exporter membrane fusion protein [Trichormus variabilis V5]